MYRLANWLGVALLAAGPAFAAHTVNAITYDPQTGVIAYIVIPDDDKDLREATPPACQIQLTSSTPLSARMS